MKIRKLILKAKLAQIENDSEYIFFFHCSGLSNGQKKYLKNLFYKTSNSLIKSFHLRPSRLNEKKEQNFIQFSKKFDIKTTNEQILKQSLTNSLKPTSSLKKVTTSFDFFQNFGPFCIIYSAKQMKITNKDNMALISCLNKINSFGYSTNFLLFYAKMKSLKMNHIDVKYALQLNSCSVYEDFFQKLQYQMDTLDFYLYQSIIILEVFISKKKNLL
uniref:Ribosomal protein L10 n=1 Tax=Roya anglica TaxID=43943 RepID=A0A6G9IEV8_9VIRI|nr:ribosomal protein L10 [Roya anglica]QIQ22995.1 ribosomal protein L10 [Roya anglica]